MDYNLGETNVDIFDVTKYCVITVKITRLKTFRFRFWLMSQLLALAAFVAPVKVEIEHEG